MLSLKQLPLSMLLLLTASNAYEYIGSVGSKEQQLKQQLDTEAVLIDTLRLYIEILQRKVVAIKSKIVSIESIHLAADKNVAAYLNNPLNVLTILRRFTEDWPELEAYIGDWNATDAIVSNSTAKLGNIVLPSESDYEEAADNLLRLQSVYDLKPENLAIGMINGIRMGSEMFWSDCLEIGKMSDKNGDYKIAKYWLQTALEKLPAVAVNDTEMSIFAPTPTTLKISENERGRVQILEALVYTEYRAGNLQLALDAVKQLLLLRRGNKSALKIKDTLEKELKQNSAGNGSSNKRQRRKKQQQQKKPSKSTEALLIEEICRAATTSTSTSTSTSNSDNYNTNHINYGHNSRHSLHCRLESANLLQLLWQPMRIEYLSFEPFIVLLHDALYTSEIDELSQLLDAEDDDNYDELTDIDNNNNDADGYATTTTPTTTAARSSHLKFTKHAEQKLEHINRKLSLATGYASAAFEPWQVVQHSHVGQVTPAVNARGSDVQIAARAIFKLKESKLGGAIIFPQLELSINVPPRAVLYWTNLDEFHEVDYRSIQHVCPIIAGTQIIAHTAIKV